MVYARIAGGLANQIYQYMGAYALAKKLDKKLTLDISMCMNGFTRGFLLNCFPKIKYDGLIKNTISGKAGVIDNLDSIKKEFADGKCILSTGQVCGKTYSDKSLKVEEYKGLNSQFTGNYEDYYLCGNWVTPEYWEEYLDELREIFFCPKEIDGYIEEFSKQDLKKTVGVHIRRGDFVYHGYTEEDDAGYYRAAIRYLKDKESDPDFYIFSDDKEYAKDILGTTDPKIHIVSSMPGLYGDVIDFCCLSLCRIKVVSGGSTYCRLAYDLNPRKDRYYVVKNRDDEGLKHRIRNLAAGRLHHQSFQCVNLNREEISSYSKKYVISDKNIGSAAENTNPDPFEICKKLFEKGEYEKAELTAHKIWSDKDDKEEFHLLYGKLLYQLGRKKEAAVEFSRTEGVVSEICDETAEAVQKYRFAEKRNFIIIPDRDIHGVSSLNGMLLTGIILRRLGNNVVFLVRHDDYFEGYLKKSPYLTDQDGTSYGCRVFSINDKTGKVEICDKIKEISESASYESTVLIGKEDYNIDGVGFFCLSEEDFIKDEQVEIVEEYSMKDVFRIDDRYFEMAEKILLRGYQQN